MKGIKSLFLHEKTSLLCLVLILLVFYGCSTQKKEKAVPIIFDTDIGPDYDDVGAIAILHVLEDQEEVKILATIASNKYEGIAEILDIFNTYYNEPGMPIGVPQGDAVNLKDTRHWTDTLLAKYPHSVKSNADIPGAVKVYRKVLSEQPDTSVTIVSVGFLTNLANLLKSEGDEFSPLSGMELVKKKVKRLVSMAGAFPSGREFNLYNDIEASKEVGENWPTPILFSGFEIGKQIKTGLPLVRNDTIKNSPVKDAFRIAMSQSPEDSAGRMSWDETAVLAAVRGHQPYFSLKEGRIEINADGSNSWNEDEEGQYYLILDESPEKMEDIINNLMMQPPEK